MLRGKITAVCRAAYGYNLSRKIVASYDLRRAERRYPDQNSRKWSMLADTTARAEHAVIVR